tara:strand:+ start:130 stop:303 length:174 start_codon:yes stop_codon:yes gene_type:complete
MSTKNYVGSIHNGLKSNKARLANKRASARVIVLDCIAVGIGDLAVPCFDTLEGKVDE